jgi:hypothetical protein
MPRDTVWERVALLTGTLSREMRDDVLDATRGQFVSHALSFSPASLGSDVPYVRYLGQYFTYCCSNRSGAFHGRDPAGLCRVRRLPPIGPFDGAAFVDIGNVWERVGAISFSSLRWSGGVGAACADALDPGPGRRRRSLRSPAR